MTKFKKELTPKAVSKYSPSEEQMLNTLHDIKIREGLHHINVNSTDAESKQDNEREEFYRKVSEILDSETTYHVPYARRTRWNARRLGNGRFKGFGLVQCFGDENVRVVSKKGTKYFKSYSDVYVYLNGLKDNEK